MRDRSVQIQVSMFVNAIRYPMICVFKGRPWIATQVLIVMTRPHTVLS